MDNEPLSPKEHVKNAITDLCAQGATPDQLMDFVNTLALGVAFVLGSLQATNSVVGQEDIDNLIDLLAEEMKRAAANVATFEPPKPN
jgi:alpha-D-ribose 1-methylphosphonate 5-phosphate C-P lyase